MIENALRKKLLSFPDFKEIIGERLYILSLPQNPTLPAATYFKLPSQRHSDIDVAMADFQIDGWTCSYSHAQKLSQALRFAIQREKGIWSGLYIISVVLDFENIDYEPDTKIYHAISQYRIKYREK